MKAGTLNQRVRIERHDGSRDELNGPNPAGWAVLASVWANIRHINGVEAIKSDKTASFVKASIRIRRRADIDASMRILHGSNIYEILAVLPDASGRQYVDLVCQMKRANV